MNRTKIEWCDFSWNPITGCLNGCPYCYARTIYKRFHRSFKPTFHYERLREPFTVKKPSYIFVCSVSEPFGDWIPIRWIRYIIEVINNCKWHTFLFLTKFPDNALYMLNKIGKIPRNLWIGATITRPKDYWRLDYLKEIPARIRFVSIEPILEDCTDIPLDGINWIIVGAETGNRKNKVKPEKQWISNLIFRAMALHRPIFIKDNVKWEKKIQQRP